MSGAAHLTLGPPHLSLFLPSSQEDSGEAQVRLRESSVLHPKRRKRQVSDGRMDCGSRDGEERCVKVIPEQPTVTGESRDGGTRGGVPQETASGSWPL